MRINQQKLMTLFLIGAIALVAFIFEAISILSETDWIAKFDLSWIEKVHSMREVGKTNFLTAVTNFGSAEYLVVATIILVVIFFLLRKFVVGLWFGGTVLFCAAILNYIIKHFVERVRPDSSTWLINETGYSFPSGHATATTVFYGLAALFLIFTVRKVWIKVLIGLAALSFIFLIMYSRVYLGVHYPTDVLGGFLFGVASIFISSAFYFALRKPLHHLLLKWRIRDKSVV